MRMRLLGAFVLSVLAASPSWAAITCDAWTASASSAGNPTVTLSYTPGTTSLTNRVVELHIHHRDTDADNTTVSSASSSAGGTWTVYGTANSSGTGADFYTQIRYSTDFADGAQTISVTYSTTILQTYLAARTCYGVDIATGPFRAAAVTATGTTGGPTLDVTGTALTDLVTDALMSGTLNAGVTVSEGAGQTLGYATNLGGDNADAGASTEPGNGATVTMSWTATGVDGWSMVAGALMEAPASSAGHLKRRTY